MMGHQQHCSSSNGGCKSVATWLVLLLLNVGLLVQCTAAQQNNFYFAQNQGRFVPSYENPRNGFFPSSIQRNQPPDSYQEQTLFVGSSATNGGRPGRGQSAASQTDNDDGPLSSRSGVTPSYFQFTYTLHPHLSSPRRLIMHRKQDTVAFLPGVTGSSCNVSRIRCHAVPRGVATPGYADSAGLFNKTDCAGMRGLFCCGTSKEADRREVLF